jgi:hypothetical protein
VVGHDLQVTPVNCGLSKLKCAIDYECVCDSVNFLTGGVNVLTGEAQKTFYFK